MSVPKMYLCMQKSLVNVTSVYMQLVQHVYTCIVYPQVAGTLSVECRGTTIDYVFYVDNLVQDK